MNKAVHALRHIRPLRRSIAGILVVVIAMPLIAFWATYQISELSNRITTVDDARLTLGLALRYALDEETGVRGFAATGVRAFLDPYHNSHKMMVPLLAQMPSQFQRAGLYDVLPELHDFSRLHNQWHATVAGPLIANPQRRNAIAVETTGRRIFDRMRADVDLIQMRSAAYTQGAACQMLGVMVAAGILAVLWILIAGTVSILLERRTLRHETDLVLSLVEEREAVERLSDWRSRLLAMLAHDFKSQLAVIIGASHLLEDFPQRRGDPLVLSSVRNAGYALAEMADNAILLARAQERRLVLYRTPFDITQVVKSVVQRYGDEREFCVTTDSATAMVDGDRTYVMRVLDNLIGNAVKYSDRPVEVHIANDDRTQVRVTVTDHGLGIAESEMPFIFEEFWRSEKVEWNKKGSGVGLFIVKQIVEAHGGSIRVESQTGKGTSVTVRFPASEQQRGELADPPKPDAFV